MDRKLAKLTQYKQRGKGVKIEQTMEVREEKDAQGEKRRGNLMKERRGETRASGKW